MLHQALPRIITNLSKITYFINLSKMESFPIQNYQVGQRLDRFLKKSPIGWISGQRLLRHKQIVICQSDGNIVNKSNYLLREGDQLMISELLKDKFAKKEIDESKSIPRDQAIKILDKMIIFDNENVTVVNKTNGFSVQGGLNPRTNLFSLMSSKYKKQMIYITHRLDKPTSGLVIFAKNKQTAQLIQMSMEERTSFHKFYLAQTQGKNMIQRQGYIRSNIQWTGKNRARICSQVSQNSKDCVTFYVPIVSQKVKSLQQQKYHNLIGIKLLTGRKHQIRCHTSGYLQQPILNDTKYGGPKTDPNSQEQEKIHLHAFGMMIKKRQIVDKVLSGVNSFANQKLGSMIVGEDGVVFTANIPEFWKIGQEQFDLGVLVKDINKIEKNCEKAKPNVRKITNIL